MWQIIRFSLSLFTNKVKLGLYFVASILQESTDLAAPYCTGVIINLIMSKPSDFKVFFAPLLGLLIALLIKAWAEFYMNVNCPKLEVDSAYTIECKIYDVIQRQPFAYFKDMDAAQLVKQINTDTNGLAYFITRDATNAVKMLGTAIIAFCILLSINVYIAFITVGFAVTSTLIYKFSNGYLYKITSDFNDDLVQYNSAAFEQLSEAAFIKRHNLFDFERKRLNKKYFKVRKSMYSYGLGYGKVFLIFGHISAVITILMLGFAGWFAFSGLMAFGFVATCYSYFQIATEAISYFVMDFVQSIQNVKVYYERSKSLLNLKEDANGTGKVSIIDQISTCDLSFGYDESMPVLNNLSLTFNKGKAYAITGVNGVGKTTLLKLLDAEAQGCYTGEIQMGADELSYFDQYALRSTKVIYLEQKPQVVGGSVWENLTLYNNNADPIEAARYLECLGARYLLDNHQKQDKMIDPAATELSGGELQKIALTRAFLAHPQVLLLDEPSSALDAESTKALVELIGAVKQKSIVLFITHDSKLMAAADEVIVL